MRRFHILLLATLTAGAAAATGCGKEAAPFRDAPTAAPAAEQTTATARAEISLAGSGTFKKYAEDAPAVVYDRGLVPSGARAEVRVESTGEETVSRLEVWKLKADRDYGVHLHVNPCGADPDDSGPHFMRSAAATSGANATPHMTPTPAGRTAERAGEPSGSGAPRAGEGATSRPNPMSEVWLDITTDADGHGTATARQSWALRPGHVPQSVVIHAKPTEPTGPQAGQAGDRAACLTLTTAGRS